LGLVADAMNDPWISGSANASYELKGTCSQDFWQSAEGTLRVDAKDGTFSHLVLGEEDEPFRATRLSGQAQLRAGKIEIADAKVDSPDGKYKLSGTASLQRQVDLKLTRTANGALASGYSISGTLAEPRIVALPGAEQARLKPLPSK